MTIMQTQIVFEHLFAVISGERFIKNKDWVMKSRFLYVLMNLADPMKCCDCTTINK